MESEGNEEKEEKFNENMKLRKKKWWATGYY